MTFQPLSAYSRIDQNRRATVGLLLVFGVLLVPVLAFLTAYLGVWLLIYLLPDFTPRGWALAQFGAMSILLGLTLWRVFYLRDTLAERLGAVPVPPGEDADPGGLSQRLRNLALGAGLPVPRLMLLDTPWPNALACGPDPARATLILSRGLIETLGPREMDAVIAHQLAHIAQGDTRLASTLAAILATVRLPAPVYWLFVFVAANSLALLPGLMVETWTLQADLVTQAMAGPGGLFAGLTPN